MADPLVATPVRPPEAQRRNGRIIVATAYFVAFSAAATVAIEMHPGSPVLVAAAADLAGTVAIFAFSVFFNNSSLYDPYWSVAPIAIAAYWLGCNPSPPGPRQIAIVALIAVWGIRLTTNWLGRWHGLGDEDFRYAEIRHKTGRWYWPASLVAIHLMPSVWVFLGLLPVLPALSTKGQPIGWLDLVALMTTTAAVVVEAVADLQLRSFLRRRTDRAAVLEAGLWGLCRHPNYFGEVLFWWGLFLFGMAADPSWIWTAIGAVSITLLFALVSIPWMDRRMLANHPAWAERMRSLPGLIPFTKLR
jgi:steroid 5-alpha reductase family enzyme